MSFGPHLMLDLSGCPKDKLEDLGLIYSILDELPTKIGMTKIIPPYVFKYNGLVPEDKGITGIVVIAESHISIHTFSEKNFVFVDVFSCKEFDTLYATNYILEKLDCRDYAIHVEHRGTSFPR